VLTTSSFIASGRIPVRLPEATVEKPPEAGETVVIEIDAAGVVYHAGASVSLEELRGLLAGMEKETSFLLRTDRETRVQSFVNVADLLKQLRFSSVGLQTVTRGGSAAP
jgi:biopolymer transport protein ExbD